MKFAELYHNNRNAVERMLNTLWTGENTNPAQAGNITALREAISRVFAPKEAMPVVQCTNRYKAVHSVSAEEARKLVGTLWKEKYDPYEHQYQSWHALLREQTEDGRPCSTVVTTGTGSGKTECFMMPLVHDLIEQKKSEQVQAIFLYPLNALMEDQKERLERLLEGTDLRFAVYNSGLPEHEPGPNDDPAEAKKIRRIIDEICGIERDKDGNPQHVKDKNGNPVPSLDGNGNPRTDEQGNIIYKTQKYEHIISTREQMRTTPPNILLTNPTMLEYMLLRSSDRKLITPKSLRWIVIDETHTYTGAGAAEIALLLRRVMLAYNVRPEQIRFATSSATFGNGTTDEARQEEQKQLVSFISGITGIRPDQVRVIAGERQGEDRLADITEEEDHRIWEELFRKEYVSLDELYPYPQETIEDKLRRLDELCDRAEQRPFKFQAKAHIFYRVPNNGLFARLTEQKDGVFRIYTDNNTSSSGNEAPLLEISYCKNCGELVVVAHTKPIENSVDLIYEPLTPEQNDMFDLPDEDGTPSETDYITLGLANQAKPRGSHCVRYKVKGNRLLVCNDEPKDGEWFIVGNSRRQCPFCQSMLNNKPSDEQPDDEPSVLDSPEPDDTRIGRYRISAEFISRILAPSILDQLDKHPADKDILHDGQQYISFVDSRQTAAANALKQNMAQERSWFYSTIFHELCRVKDTAAQSLAERKDLKEELKKLDPDDDEYRELQQKIEDLKGKSEGYMTWQDIYNLIHNDSYCDLFCYLFLDKHKELTDNGDDIKPEVKEQYVHSIMAMYLGKRPLRAASPETMGLFHSFYPALARIKALPKAVENFNSRLTDPNNKISIADWQNLIQLYLDYTVRSNQSVFLHPDGNSQTDIMKCVRFAAEKPRRRTAHKPKINDRGAQHRIVRMLGALLARDQKLTNELDAIRNNTDMIQPVVDALWDALLKEKDATQRHNRLLEHGETCKEGAWTPDKSYGKAEKLLDDEQADSKEQTFWRFNLANLCFKLYDEAWLVDTNTKLSSKIGNAKQHHNIKLRPIENNFKHFSPYPVEGKIVELDDMLHQPFELYPDYGQQSDKATLDKWAQEKRQILWQNNIWNENGIFADYLEAIHLRPNLFIQGEHTAQVDKMAAKKLQAKFKAHKVNILSCSTTMEMGVDLGNLELVLLTSVPPQPSNYKQRAGRGGRNDKVRSACITLCGSDIVGLRTLYHPIERIIKRPVSVPRVDLMSPQVVQRHVSSFLIYYTGVFPDGNINECVASYYTPYHINRNKNNYLRLWDNAGNRIMPTQYIGIIAGTDNEPALMPGTLCQEFENKCNEYLAKIPLKLEQDLKILLKGTIYHAEGEDSNDKLVYVIKRSKEENKRCFNEIAAKVNDIVYEYKRVVEERPGQDNESGYLGRLYLQFLSLLNERLISYWATNRFTPNANMPVNVVQFDLASSGKFNQHSSVRYSNPSYSLREALSQYAPGNNIIVDGVVYKVRGISFQNQYCGVNAFKHVYRNKDKVVIDDSSLSDQITWDVNKKTALELINPISFLPDINDQGNRIVDKQQFTHVSSQLIGTTEWDTKPHDPHLFSVRTNREIGDARILYYNEGAGRGFCLCVKCGKMVVEERVANENLINSGLPYEMDNRISDDGKRRYHNAIVKDKKGKRKCNADSKNYRRNLITGDAIQTDFCEIKIRHNKRNVEWIVDREKDKKLLITLGIVLSQSLVEILGKENDAVDFAITPNAHICIFDTNPGGAGYSNQLAHRKLMDDVIDEANKILKEAIDKQSIDLLLNRSTMKHQNDIDVQAALDWTENEIASRTIMPTEVIAVYPKAVEVTYEEMIDEIKKSASKSTIFVDDNYDNWNYDYEPDQCWRNRFFHQLSNKGNSLVFCVARASDQSFVSMPVRNSISKITGWMNPEAHTMLNKQESQGLYPLAYAEGKLYFTNDPEHKSLDCVWAGGTIYCSETENPADDSTIIDLTEIPSKTSKIKFYKGKKLSSLELGNEIYAESKNVVDQFIDFCNNNKEEQVIIRYQDRYLNSPFAMALTLQIVDFFVRKFDNDIVMKYKVESYKDQVHKGDPKVFDNVKTASERDKRLNEMTEQWLQEFKDRKTKLEPAKLKFKIPHDRELWFKCKNNSLWIYPDAGFAYGWHIEDNLFKTDIVWNQEMQMTVDPEYIKIYVEII